MRWRSRYNESSIPSRSGACSGARRLTGDAAAEGEKDKMELRDLRTGFRGYQKEDVGERNAAPPHSIIPHVVRRIIISSVTPTVTASDDTVRTTPCLHMLFAMMPATV